MDLRNFIKTILRENFNTQQNVSGTLKLYHGTYNEEFNIDDNYIWLAEDIEYSKIWGDNIFEVEVRLNKVLDTYSDLYNRKFTLSQFAKYLEKKGVDTSDFKHVMRKYMNDEKFNFWQLIGNQPSIIYNWLSSDIFFSGYDAICLFEYAYDRKDKGKTYLVNKPKNKILSIKKIL